MFLLSEEPEGECNGIDTTSVCQASDSSSGLPWSDTKFKKPEESEVDDSMENEEDATQENSESPPLDIAQGFAFYVNFISNMFYRLLYMDIAFNETFKRNYIQSLLIEFEKDFLITLEIFCK